MRSCLCCAHCSHCSRFQSLLHAMEEPISEPKEAPWSRDNASLADFDYAGRLFAQALDLVQAAGRSRRAAESGSSTVARQRAQRAQHERDAVLRWAEEATTRINTLTERFQRGWAQMEKQQVEKRQLEARCELLRSQLKAAEMEGLALRADAEAQRHSRSAPEPRVASPRRGPVTWAKEVAWARGLAEDCRSGAFHPPEVRRKKRCGRCARLQRRLWTLRRSVRHARDLTQQRLAVVLAAARHDGEMLESAVRMARRRTLQVIELQLGQALGGAFAAWASFRCRPEATQTGLCAPFGALRTAASMLSPSSSEPPLSFRSCVSPGTLRSRGRSPEQSPKGCEGSCAHSGRGMTAAIGDLHCSTCEPSASPGSLALRARLRPQGEHGEHGSIRELSRNRLIALITLYAQGADVAAKRSAFQDWCTATQQRRRSTARLVGHYERLSKDRSRSTDQAHSSESPKHGRQRMQSVLKKRWDAEPLDLLDEGYLNGLLPALSGSSLALIPSTRKEGPQPATVSPFIPLRSPGQAVRAMLATASLSMMAKKAPPNKVMTAYGVFLTAALAVYHFIANGEFSAILTLAVIFQCLGFALLCVQVLLTGTCTGISARALALDAWALCFRLSSTLWLNGYLPVDASGDWAYQAVDIVSLVLVLWLLHSLLFEKKHTYQEEQDQTSDTFPATPVVLACLALAVAFHADMNSRPIFDTLWMAGAARTRVVGTSKAWLVLKDSRSHASRFPRFPFLALAEWIWLVGSHLFVVPGLFISVFMWHARFDITCDPWVGGFNHAIWVILGAHALHMLLLGDFGYYYIKTVMKGGLTAQLDLIQELGQLSAIRLLFLLLRRLQDSYV
eukprot:s1244_g3.t1